MRLGEDAKMNENDWLLGFDAREMWYYGDLEGMRTREPGSIGLLRQDIAKPLSVDSSIWASVFNDGQVYGLSDQERREIGLGTIRLPEWIGQNNVCWQHLEELEKYLASHHAQLIRPYWTIGITAAPHGEDVPASTMEGPTFEPTTPAVRHKSWRLVGYDIADKWMEAMLTGPGFEGEEPYLRSLQERWRPHLNEYHLFRDVDKALEFREFTTETVPTQAPFFVYGIWLIKEERGQARR
jgi:hypothetical protein